MQHQELYTKHQLKTNRYSQHLLEVCLQYLKGSSLCNAHPQCMQKIRSTPSNRWIPSNSFAALRSSQGKTLCLQKNEDSMQQKTMPASWPLAQRLPSLVHSVHCEHCQPFCLWRILSPYSTHRLSPSGRRASGGRTKPVPRDLPIHPGHISDF